MERLNAALEGRYVIESELGEGGMATVFLAKDLKHNRNVALKVLKPDLAAVVGAERFLTEIETTANLQHPNILPLYDSGEADSFLFYVMPHVQGETLADRLDQEKQLPVDEAVGIAVSVASALDYAHRQGVVHRDIKPANILFQDGQPVVGDFGIALAVGAGGGARLTETGLSVGTPFYMSPEQATGDMAVGPASDIYAVACVLYEMLTGEPPYTGSTAQAVLGRIIQGQPVSATSMRRSVPAHVDAAIRKGLEKLPADRFTAANEFARVLGEPTFRHGESDAPAWAPTSSRWRNAAMALGATTVLALAAGLTGVFGNRGDAPATLRVQIDPPGSVTVEADWGRHLALAPDGSGMVYGDWEGAQDGEWLLYYKPRGTVEGTLLPGTEQAHDLVMSPDGQWVAFIQEGRVVKRPVRGGATVTLAEDAGNNYTALDWLEDGTILYEVADGDMLVRISENGGTPPDTVADPQSLRWARGLPGGDAALVLDCPGCRLGIADFTTKEIDYVLDDVARAWYLPTGHIVYVRADGAVFATEFDLRTHTLAAGGTPLFDGVRTGIGSADMVVGNDGTMVYVTGSARTQGDVENLVWAEADGAVTPVDTDWASQNMLAPALSPDETKIAIPLADESGSVDLWVKELPAGPLTPLTRGGGRAYHPRWTPDGRSVVYTFFGPGVAPDQVRRIRADGSQSEAEVLFAPDTTVADIDLGPGGEGLLFRTSGSSADIGYWDAEVDSITWLLTSEHAEMAPALSPDGRWLAYTSNVSGDLEVFVRPFPNVTESRTQVSIGGGSEPVWSRDGDEIFYRSNGSMMVASFEADATFTVNARTDLFDMGFAYILRPGSRAYDVGRSRRFLLVQNAESAEGEEGEVAAMILVENWFTELAERLGGGK
jgi:serine/threonine-protein kinase